MFRKNILRVTNSISILFVFCAILFITGCNDKKVEVHNYNEIISTSNIKNIEFRSKKEDDFRYDLDYVTLSDDEKELFINSISSGELKYTPYKKGIHTSQYYENQKDTFIIHYEDGSKTYFDNEHVKKLDNSDSVKFDEKLIAYDCAIGQNIFMEKKEASPTFPCDYYLVKKLEMNREAYDMTFDIVYGYRCYRSINGHISTDYYDVYYTDGRITSIYKSDFDYANQKIYDIKKEGYKIDKDDETITKSTQSIIYYLDDKYATPMEVTYIYRNNKIDIIEVNLYTGEMTTKEDYIKQ